MSLFVFVILLTWFYKRKVNSTYGCIDSGKKVGETHPLIEDIAQVLKAGCTFLETLNCSQIVELVDNAQHKSRDLKNFVDYWKLRKILKLTLSLCKDEFKWTDKRLYILNKKKRYDSSQYRKNWKNVLS